MPLFESSCRSIECVYQERVVEWLGKYDDPDPLCGGCGQQMEREVSRFGIVWTGPLTQRYKDPTMDGYHGDGGHWAWKTKNTISGKPEPIYIDSFSSQKQFCRDEGLGLPQDAGAATISSDGKTMIPISNSEARDMREHSAHEAAKPSAVE